MIAHSARNTAVLAAAIITGAAASAFGQQVANLDIQRKAYLEQQCGHIADATRQVGCIAEKSIEFSRAQTTLAKQRIESNKGTLAAQDELIRCIGFLQDRRKSGAVFNRTITRENVCEVAREHGLN